MSKRSGAARGTPNGTRSFQSKQGGRRCGWKWLLSPTTVPGSAASLSRHILGTCGITKWDVPTQEHDWEQVEGDKHVWVTGTAFA